MDHTNRGSIITSLRSRIRSLIIMHHRLACEDVMAIAAQKSWIKHGGED